MKRLSISILLLSVIVGCTSNASSPLGPSGKTPSMGSDIIRVGERGGMIRVVRPHGSAVLTSGFSPKLSPDRTMIAFLRDPRDRHYSGAGDPFVLQAWLIYPDGSGLRKLGQQPECCVGASAQLTWSSDGSSIFLTGTHDQEIAVTLGESPSQSPAD